MLWNWFWFQRPKSICGGITSRRNSGRGNLLRIPSRKYWILKWKFRRIYLKTPNKNSWFPRKSSVRIPWKKISEAIIWKKKIVREFAVISGTSFQGTAEGTPGRILEWISEKTLKKWKNSRRNFWISTDRASNEFHLRRNSWIKWNSWKISRWTSSRNHWKNFSSNTERSIWYIITKKNPEWSRVPGYSAEVRTSFVYSYKTIPWNFKRKITRLPCTSHGDMQEEQYEMTERNPRGEFLVGGYGKPWRNFQKNT